MSDILKVYYQPPVTVGQAAIDKLVNAGFKPVKVKFFLAKQALWQIHIPAPKEVIHPHYQVEKPNKLHMVDLLTMPADKVLGNNYKYILVLVDVASRYVEVRPLRNKRASDVAFALKDIYKRLPYPEELYCDGGNEFKGEFRRLLEEHNVKVKSKVTAYHHGFTGSVETVNRLIAKQLFKAMDAQELNNDSKKSKIWVKQLQKVILDLNMRNIPKIGMSPAEAIKLDNVPLKKPLKYRKEKLLATDGLFRYLLQPGEEHGDQRRRATDNVWSRKTYRLSDIIQDPGQRIIYHLFEGPDRAFVREELMRIPEDTQNPPDFVQKW